MTLKGKWSKLRFWNTPDWQKLKDIEGIPAPRLRLRALEMTSYEDTRVVILGQDPYPNREHAHGLCFSVQPHVERLPISLNNVLSEYRSDLGYPRPRHGCLDLWAHRGVLMLNSALSVAEGQPESHKGLGWEKLTFEILRLLDDKDSPVVVILWGKQAQEYKATITNTNRHLVLTAPHPSPRSARLGFFGSKPFSQAAEHLGVSNTLWKLT